MQIVLKLLIGVTQLFWKVVGEGSEVEVLFWLDRCNSTPAAQLRRKASRRNVLLTLTKTTFSPLDGAVCYKDVRSLNFNLCGLFIVFRWQYISAPAKVINMSGKSDHAFSNIFCSFSKILLHWQWHWQDQTPLPPRSLGPVDRYLKTNVVTSSCFLLWIRLPFSYIYKDTNKLARLKRCFGLKKFGFV